MNLDRWIESEDRDDEPREPPCRECGGIEGDHPVTCSFSADYYEPPTREYDDDESEIPCDGD